MGRYSGNVILRMSNCGPQCKFYKKGSEASSIIRKEITLRQYLLRNLHLFLNKEICIYNPDNFKVISSSCKNRKCYRFHGEAA